MQWLCWCYAPLLLMQLVVNIWQNYNVVGAAISSGTTSSSSSLTSSRSKYSSSSSAQAHPHVLPEDEREWTQNKDIGMRITLRRENFDQAPSCIYSFAQIELLNLMDDEAIYVETVQTSFPEITLDRAHHTMYDLQQQFFITRLSSKHLRIGPKQVAIIPVRFLPRFPASLSQQDTSSQTDGYDAKDNDHDEYYFDPDSYYDCYPFAEPSTPSRNTTASPSMLPSSAPSSLKYASAPPVMHSWAQKVDLKTWLGSTSNNSQQQHQSRKILPNRYKNRRRERSTQRRKRKRQTQKQDKLQESENDDSKSQAHFEVKNNTCESCCLDPPTFLVRAHIIVETNRGIMTLPIHAISVRRNEYGVADVLRFQTQKKSKICKPDSCVTEQHDSESIKPHQKYDKNITNAIRTTYRTSRGRQQNDLGRNVSQHTKNTVFEKMKETEGYDEDDCHDIYLKHPLGSDTALGGGDDIMNVVEVSLITKATLTNGPPMTLKILPRDPLLLPTKKGEPASTLISTISSSPSALPALYLRQVIRDWTNGSSDDAIGPRPIPPDDRLHYLVTVCTTNSTNVKPSTSTDVFQSSSSSSSSSSRKIDNKSCHHGNNEEVQCTDERWDDELPANSIHSLPRLNHELEILMSDKSRHYVDSSSTKVKDWFGILQIHTDIDTLFVGLEEAIDPKYVHGADNFPPCSDNNNFRKESGKEYTCLTADLNNSIMKDDFCFLLDSDDKDWTVEFDEETSHQGSVLLATPDCISIHFLSSASSSTRVPINITNIASHLPVKIMRVSAVWNTSVSGLDERAGFKIMLPGQSLTEATPIEYNTTFSKVFDFECAVNWDKLVSDQSLEEVIFSGSIVVRGSIQSMDYDEWETAMRTYPRLESDCVVEIPFTVTIVKGNIGFVVQGTSHPFPLLWQMTRWLEYTKSISGIFFPLTSNDIRAVIADDENADKDLYTFQNMDHHLRVFSNIVMRTEVKDVIIIDEDGFTLGSQSMNPLCERFDVAFIRFPGSNPFDLPNQADLGLIHIRYQIPNTSIVGKVRNRPVTTANIIPTVCNLRLTTTPDTGEHFIPLLVYSGQLQVSGSLYSVDKGSQNGKRSVAEQTIGQRTVVGFEKLTTWLQTTKSGAALRAMLGSSRENKSIPVRDTVLLGRYLDGLARQSVQVESTKLRPILLQAGAIAQGEIEVLPLYLTNHNPVPIQVTIDVGEVEGMSITLGRDSAGGKGSGNNLMDFLPKTPLFRLVRDTLRVSEPRVNIGPFHGHPLNGLRQFLLTDETASNFLSQFTNRDAVFLSEGAIQRTTILDMLFRNHAVMRFYKAARRTRVRLASKHRCGDVSVHPPMYGRFDKKRKIWRRLPGPIIISSDGKIARQLPVCWDKTLVQGDQTPDDGFALLPPGGVARFDVTLRSPPHSVLNKDITEFLATGLVISTNHDEVMPVLVTFEALQGRLDVTHILSSANTRLNGISGSERKGVIRVPIGLFFRPQNLSTIFLNIPPKKYRPISNVFSNSFMTRNRTVDTSEVSIYIKSSFSRDVTLREISSCNPWFQVILKNDSQTHVDPFLGVNVGIVKSVASCDKPFDGNGNDFGYPSFFRCVLSWLSHRAKFQPRGCGLLTTNEGLSVDTSRILNADRSGFERFVRSLKQTYFIVEASFSSPYTGVNSFSNDPEKLVLVKKSGERSPDGVLSSAIIDSMADVWNSWLLVSAVGFLTLSTSLRALIEYDSSANGSVPQRTHVLSVALSNLTVESVLEVPKLIDQSLVRNTGVTKATTDDGIVMVEFLPTLVSEVNWIMLPLQNPTAVPIKARLGVVSPAIGEDTDILVNEIGLDNFVREKYVGTLPAPYIQHGNVRHLGESGAQHDRWWEGEGSFYLLDFRGDVIRSSHDIVVASGANAHVGLRFPSIFANSLFLTGCGARCAVKDELKKSSWVRGTRATIGVGASAAAREGKSSFSEHIDCNHENWISSSSSINASLPILSGTGGSSAFAIPYSALDEIVVPPFGKAELGPIFFRPPGRTNHLGCLAGSQFGITCESGLFESSLFLENSMSGLERITLRGQAQLVALDFVDHFSSEELDGFSSIEYRLGRTAVVFSGLSQCLKDHDCSIWMHKPVVKTVMLHNYGDVTVSIDDIYMSSTRNFLFDSFKKRCEFGDFQILNCETLSQGFVLKPGENHSISIQHKPSCRRKQSLIIVNFRAVEPLRTAEHLDPYLNTIFWNRGLANKFQVKRIELLVDHDQPKNNGTGCTRLLARRHGSNDDNFLFDTLGHGKMLAVSTFIYHLQSVQWIGSSANILRILKFIIIWSVLLTTSFLMFERAKLRSMFANAIAVMLKTFDLKSDRETQPSAEDNWISALRCLARADPSSSELQSLGKDQTRLIVLAKYKFMGRFQPQCLGHTGAFHRERHDHFSKFGRHNSTAKEGNNSGGGERVRTLSDAIFLNYANDTSYEVHIPHALDWRAAAVRGIMDVESIEKFRCKSRLLSLLRSRNENLRDEEISVVNENALDDMMSSSVEGESVTFHASEETNFSFDESSDQSIDTELHNHWGPHSTSEDIVSTAHLSETGITGPNDVSVMATLSTSTERMSAPPPSAKVTAEKELTGSRLTIDIEPSLLEECLITNTSDKTGMMKPQKLSAASMISGFTDASVSRLLDEKPSTSNLSRKEKAVYLEKKETLSGKTEGVRESSSQQSLMKDRLLQDTSVDLATFKESCDEGTETSLRPPPGIPPPPGFDVTLGNFPSVGTSNAVTSGLTQPNDVSEVADWTSRRILRHGLGDNYDLSLSTSPGVSSFLSSLDGIPSRSQFDVQFERQTEMTGFDVLDFLDGILNDGGASAMNIERTETIFSSDDLSANVVSTDGSLVASNPWAMPSMTLAESADSLNERPSRLLAYGVSIDSENDHRMGVVSSPSPVSFPEDNLALLTSNFKHSAQPEEQE